MLSYLGKLHKRKTEGLHLEYGTMKLTQALEARKDYWEVYANVEELQNLSLPFRQNNNKSIPICSNCVLTIKGAKSKSRSICSMIASTGDFAGKPAMTLCPVL
jgi:hypothetical protein